MRWNANYSYNLSESTNFLQTRPFFTLFRIIPGTSAHDICRVVPGVIGRLRLCVPARINYNRIFTFTLCLFYQFDEFRKSFVRGDV
jgi:hypothetical protein